MPIITVAIGSLTTAVTGAVSRMTDAVVGFLGGIANAVITFAQLVLVNPVAFLFIVPLVVVSFLWFPYHHVVIGAISTVQVCGVAPVARGVVQPVVNSTMPVIERVFEAYNFVVSMAKNLATDLALIPLKCSKFPEFIRTVIRSIPPILKSASLLLRLCAFSVTGSSANSTHVNIATDMLFSSVANISSAASGVVECYCEMFAYPFDLLALLLSDVHTKCTTAQLLAVVLDLVAATVRLAVDILDWLANVIIWMVKGFGGRFPLPAVWDAIERVEDASDALDAAACCASDLIDDLGNSAVSVLVTAAGGDRNDSYVGDLRIGGVVKAVVHPITATLYATVEFTHDSIVDGFDAAVRKFDDGRLFGAFEHACEDASDTFRAYINGSAELSVAALNLSTVLVQEIVGTNATGLGPGMSGVGATAKLLAYANPMLLLTSPEMISHACKAGVHLTWAATRIAIDSPSYGEYAAGGYLNCHIDSMRKAADFVETGVNEIVDGMIPLPKSCTYDYSRGVLPFCGSSLFNGSVGRVLASVPRALVELENYAVAVSEHSGTFVEARRVSTDGVFDELELGLVATGDALQALVSLLSVDMVKFIIPGTDITFNLGDHFGVGDVSAAVSGIGIVTIETARFFARTVHRGKFSEWSFDYADVESLARRQYDASEALSRLLTSIPCGLRRSNTREALSSVEIGLGGPAGTGVHPFDMPLCMEDSAAHLVKASLRLVDSVMTLVLHPDAFSDELFDRSLCELENAAGGIEDAMRGWSGIVINVSSWWGTDPTTIDVGSWVTSAVLSATRAVSAYGKLMSMAVSQIVDADGDVTNPWGNFTVPQCAADPTAPIAVFDVSEGRTVCVPCGDPRASDAARGVGYNGDVCFAMVGKRTRCCKSVGTCSRSCGQSGTYADSATACFESMAAAWSHAASPLSAVDPALAGVVRNFGLAATQIVRSVLRSVGAATGAASGSEQKFSSSLGDAACAIDRVAWAAGNALGFGPALLGRIVWAATGKGRSEVAANFSNGFLGMSRAVVGMVGSIGGVSSEISALGLRGLGMLLDGNVSADAWGDLVLGGTEAIECGLDGVRAATRALVASIDVSGGGRACEIADVTEAIVGVSTSVMKIVLRAIGSISGRGARVSVSDLIKSLRRLAIAGGNMVGGTLQSAVGLISGEAEAVVSGVLDGIGGIVGATLNVPVSVLESATDLIGLVIPFLRDIVDGLPEDPYEPLRVIADAAARLITAMANAVGSFWPTGGTWLEVLSKLLRVAFIDESSPVVEIMSATLRFVFSLFNLFFSLFGGDIGAAASEVGSAFMKLLGTTWFVIEQIGVMLIDMVIGVKLGKYGFIDCMRNFGDCVWNLIGSRRRDDGADGEQYLVSDRLVAIAGQFASTDSCRACLEGAAAMLRGSVADRVDYNWSWTLPDSDPIAKAGRISVITMRYRVARCLDAIARRPARKSRADATECLDGVCAYDRVYGAAVAAYGAATSLGTAAVGGSVADAEAKLRLMLDGADIDPDVVERFVALVASTSADVSSSIFDAIESVRRSTGAKFTTEDVARITKKVSAVLAEADAGISGRGSPKSADDGTGSDVGRRSRPRYYWKNPGSVAGSRVGRGESATGEPAIGADVVSPEDAADVAIAESVRGEIEARRDFGIVVASNRESHRRVAEAIRRSSSSSLSQRAATGSCPNPKWCGHDISWSSGLNTWDARVDSLVCDYTPPDEGGGSGPIVCPASCPNCTSAKHQLSISALCPPSRCSGGGGGGFYEYELQGFCARICGSAATSNFFRVACPNHWTTAENPTLEYWSRAAATDAEIAKGYPGITEDSLEYALVPELRNPYEPRSADTSHELCSWIGRSGLETYPNFCRDKCDLGYAGSFVRQLLAGKDDPTSWVMSRGDGFQLLRFTMNMCGNFCYPFDRHCRGMKTRISCGGGSLDQMTCLKGCDLDWTTAPGTVVVAPQSCSAVTTAKCASSDNGGGQFESSCRCPIPGSAVPTEQETCSCSYTHGSFERTATPHNVVDFICPETYATPYTFWSGASRRVLDALTAINVVRRANYTPSAMVLGESIEDLHSDTFDGIRDPGQKCIVYPNYVPLNQSELDAAGIPRNITTDFPDPLAWECTETPDGSVWVARIDVAGYNKIRHEINDTVGECIPNVHTFAPRNVSASWMLSANSTRCPPVSILGIGTCYTADGRCWENATYDDPKPGSCDRESLCSKGPFKLKSCASDRVDMRLSIRFEHGGFTNFVSECQMNRTVVTKLASVVWVHTRNDGVGCSDPIYAKSLPAYPMVDTQNVVCGASYTVPVREELSLPSISFGDFVARVVVGSPNARPSEDPNYVNAIQMFYPISSGTSVEHTVTYSDTRGFCDYLCDDGDAWCSKLLTGSGLNCTRYAPKQGAHGRFAARSWFCGRFPARFSSVNSSIFPISGTGLHSKSSGATTVISDMTSPASSCPSVSGWWGNNYALSAFSGVDDTGDACVMRAPEIPPYANPSTTECANVAAYAQELTRFHSRVAAGEFTARSRGAADPFNHGAAYSDRIEVEAQLARADSKELALFGAGGGKLGRATDRSDSGSTCATTNCEIGPEPSAGCSRYPDPVERPGDAVPRRTCSVTGGYACDRTAAIQESGMNTGDPEGAYDDLFSTKKEENPRATSKAVNSEEQLGTWYGLTSAFSGYAAEMRRIRRSYRVSPPGVVKRLATGIGIRLEMAACATFPRGPACARLDRWSDSSPSRRSVKGSGRAAGVPGANGGVLWESTRNRRASTVGEAFSRKWVQVIPGVEDVFHSCYLWCGYNYKNLLIRSCLRDLAPESHPAWGLIDAALEANSEICSLVFETSGAELHAGGTGFDFGFNASKIVFRRSNVTSISWSDSTEIVRRFKIALVNLIGRALGVKPNDIGTQDIAEAAMARALGIDNVTAFEAAASKWLKNTNLDADAGPVGGLYWVLAPIISDCAKANGTYGIRLPLLGRIPLYSPLWGLLPTWLPNTTINIAAWLGRPLELPQTMVLSDGGCSAYNHPSNTEFRMPFTDDCNCTPSYMNCAEAYGFASGVDTFAFAVNWLAPSVARWKITRMFAWLSFSSGKISAYQNITANKDFENYKWCFYATLPGTVWFVPFEIAWLVLIALTFVTIAYAAVVFLVWFIIILLQ